MNKRVFIFWLIAGLVGLCVSGAQASEIHKPAKTMPVFGQGEKSHHLHCPLNNHMHPGDICPRVSEKNWSNPGLFHIGTDCGGLPYVPGPAKNLFQGKPDAVLLPAAANVLPPAGLVQARSQVPVFQPPDTPERPPRFI